MLPAERIPDDTEYLQSLLDKGGQVTLDTGRVYRISAGHGSRSALYVGPDTFVDLAGATIELAPDQRCSMIMQRSGIRPVNNAKIANGVLLGNGPLQPTDYRRDIGITPTLYLMHCDGLKLQNLTMRDTYMYAIYAQGDRGEIDNIDVSDAIGGGIHLNGSGWRVDNVRVQNVSYFERVNCQGNPFIVSLKTPTLAAFIARTMVLESSCKMVVKTLAWIPSRLLAVPITTTIL